MTIEFFKAQEVPVKEYSFHDFVIHDFFFMMGEKMCDIFNVNNANRNFGKLINQ